MRQAMAAERVGRERGGGALSTGSNGGISLLASLPWAWYWQALFGLGLLVAMALAIVLMAIGMLGMAGVKIEWKWR